MLWTLFGIFLALWVFGMVSNNTLHGFIHVLLGLAVVMLLIRFIGGRHRA